MPNAAYRTFAVAPRVTIRALVGIPLPNGGTLERSTDLRAGDKVRADLVKARGLVISGIAVEVENDANAPTLITLVSKTLSYK